MSQRKRRISWFVSIRKGCLSCMESMVQFNAHEFIDLFQFDLKERIFIALIANVWHRSSHKQNPISFMYVTPDERFSNYLITLVYPLWMEYLAHISYKQWRRESFDFHYQIVLFRSCKNKHYFSSKRETKWNVSCQRQNRFIL